MCFPFLGGVVELGVTDSVPYFTFMVSYFFHKCLTDMFHLYSALLFHFKVPEDPALFQHVMASLSETPQLRPSMKFHHEIFETKMNPISGELQIVSPTMRSDGIEEACQAPNQLLMVGGVNVAASQAQSRQFMVEDFNSSLQHSVNSSDCISHTFIDLENVIQYPLDKNESKGNDKDKLGLNAQDDDFHYQSTLWDLLKTSKEFSFGPNLGKTKRESSFRAWKDGGPTYCSKQRSGTHQGMLKCILFEVSRMHDKGLTESPIESCREENRVWKPEADEMSTNHVSAERRESDKINERLSVLKSMISSANKVPHRNPIF